MGKEYDTVDHGPWLKGMNNRKAELELHGGDIEYLRDAFNVDVGNTGRVRRRRGFTRLSTGESTHSLFATPNHFLFCDEDTLYRGVPPAQASVLTGLLTLAPMAYVEVNDEVRLSNGIITKRMRQDGTLTPWGVATPPGAPAGAATGGGGMAAGRYQVAVTHVAPDGEESGASGVVAVEVSEGGGIALTGIPQSPDGYATSTYVYVTKENGDLFYFYASLAMGVTSLNITANPVLGPSLDTFHLVPFPPCTLLEYYNAQVYGALGPFVFYSEPFRYGLYRPAQNFIMFPADVTVLKAVEDGLYVCADKTYWLGGPTPKAASQRTLLPYGAVPGTGVKHENKRQVAWFSPKGYVLGDNGGAITLASDDNVAVPAYTSGALLYREDRGLRQLTGAMGGATETIFEASDYAEAELVRGET